MYVSMYVCMYVRLCVSTCFEGTSLRAADCQGYLVPVFLLYLFCNGIKPMSAQKILVPAKYTAGQSAAFRQIRFEVWS